MAWECLNGKTDNTDLEKLCWFCKTHSKCDDCN